MMSHMGGAAQAPAVDGAGAEAEARYRHYRQQRALYADEDGYVKTEMELAR
jgi:hypothetical protein